MRNKTDYEVAKGRVDRKSTGSKKSQKKAVFVSMKPDKVDKEAVQAILDKWEDIWEYIGQAVQDERIALSLKWETEQECWKVQVCDNLAKWPDITYYTFRHTEITKVLGYVLYVLVEHWQGLLPTEIKRQEDINW